MTTNNSMNGSLSENETILNLMSRINDLALEIHKMSDISNEALQNNHLWHSKYEKLKELYLKNIHDELTLEDLIAGRITFDDVKLDFPSKSQISITSPKNFTNEQERKINELISKNKDLESKLMNSQDELSRLKSEYNKLEIGEIDNNQSEQKALEMKYQIKISELENEIFKVKNQKQDSNTNEKKYEALLNDFNLLKEEKKKMENFYQKKIKEAEQEALKRKKASPPQVYQNQTIKVGEPQLKEIEKLESHQVNQLPIQPQTQKIQGEPNFGDHSSNMLFGPKGIEETQIKQNKGLNNLETINEIRTNERIEDLTKEDSHRGPPQKKNVNIANEASIQKRKTSVTKNAQNTSTKKPVNNKPVKKQEIKKGKK